MSPLARKEIPHWQTQKEETKIQDQVKRTDNIQGWKVFNETKEKGGGQAICITEKACKDRTEDKMINTIVSQPLFLLNLHFFKHIYF